MEYLPPSLILPNLPFVEDKATLVVSQPSERSKKARFTRKNLTKKQKMNIILGVLIGLALVVKALQKTTKDFHS